MSDPAATPAGAAADTRAAKAPGDTLTALLAGDTVAERLDALFGRHFGGTELAGVTRFWNAVHAFKEDVKRLVAETFTDEGGKGAATEQPHGDK